MRNSSPRARIPWVKPPAPVLCGNPANQLEDALKEEPTQPGLADAAVPQISATEPTTDSAGESHNPIKSELEAESRESKEAGGIEPPA
jgi:hypothetical protein